MARSSLTKEYFFSVVSRDGDPEAVRDAEVDDYLLRSENIILAYTASNGNPAYGVWVDAICSAIQMDMVKRVYFNPAALASEAMGPENQSFTAPGGLFLLPAEREQLDKLKVGDVFGGLGTLRMVRPDFGNW